MNTRLESVNIDPGGVLTTGISNDLRALMELRELSGRLGRDPLLVQASSGNTSVKLADTLWIKASGKWLANPEANDFLTSVKLGRARKCLDENVPIPETEAPSSGKSRASIETAMHAVLPDNVVVHVHSVNAIAWALQADGSHELRKRLLGLDWQWISYAPSGVPLARSIEGILAEFPRTNVFILANHGLVICGPDCRSAERLLTEVEQRLQIAPRPAPAEHRSLVEKTRAGSSWSLPRDPRVHALATDRGSQRILSGGVLYPCQAIFLPGTIPLQDSRLVARGRTSPRTPVLIAGQGVLCSRHVTQAEDEMLTGLVEIVQRIDPTAPLRYLTSSELIGVFNEGAENYRRYASR